MKTLVSAPLIALSFATTLASLLLTAVLVLAPEEPAADKAAAAAAPAASAVAVESDREAWPCLNAA